MNLSILEADLISAAAQSKAAMHSVAFKALEALDMDSDDRDAVIAMLEAESAIKTAGPMIGPGAVNALALGVGLAGPAAAAIKWMTGRKRYEDGWSDLTMTAPDVIGHNPVRAKAIYDFVHSSAPNVATNPVVMGDVLRQMMSMPQVDIGTVDRLAGTGKAMSDANRGQGFAADVKSYGDASQGVRNIFGAGKAANYVPVRHYATDKTPCIIDWSTPAMKKAGLTDAFTGNGTNIEQANNSTIMSQMSDGQNMLPLDAVVRELMMKEMELAQREQMLQQQEQMVQQQVMQMQQQMGGIYQQQTGVNPSTGEPAELQNQAGQPGEEQPAMDQQMAPEQQADGQQPTEQPPTEEQQPAEEQQQPAPGAIEQATQEQATTQPGQDPAQLAQEQAAQTQGAQDQATEDQAATQVPPVQPDQAAMDQATHDQAEDQQAAEKQPAPAELPTPEAQADQNVATETAAPDQAEQQVPEGAEAAEPPRGEEAVSEQAAEPTPEEVAPAAVAAPMPAAPAQPGVTQTPEGFQINIPLPSIQVSVKMAEADPAELERQKALAGFEQTLSNLFRP